MAPATPSEAHPSPFRVPLILHVLGDVVHRHPSFWIRLGRLETGMLLEELRQLAVRMPIYVCGLARSGSTLLHEVIADHPGVATHRSKDFPMVFTPYWWRQATAGLPETAPRERAARRRHDGDKSKPRFAGRNGLDGVLPRFPSAGSECPPGCEGAAPGLRKLLRRAHPEADARREGGPLRREGQLPRRPPRLPDATLSRREDRDPRPGAGRSRRLATAAAASIRCRAAGASARSHTCGGPATSNSDSTAGR